MRASAYVRELCERRGTKEWESTRSYQGCAAPASLGRVPVLVSCLKQPAAAHDQSNNNRLETVSILLCHSLLWKRKTCPSCSQTTTTKNQASNRHLIKKGWTSAITTIYSQGSKKKINNCFVSKTLSHVQSGVDERNKSTNSTLHRS